VRPEWEAIMNTDVEDLLREGMERFTADLRAPAGLTRSVVRRRRRRLALRATGGFTTVLTAGAVALAVVVVVPGAGHGGTGSAVLTADVVKRVDGALTTADPGDIAQMTVTTHRAALPGSAATTTTSEEWSYGDQWRSVTNSPSGQPVDDEGFSPSTGYTLVSYLKKEWAREPGLGRPAGFLTRVPSATGCEPVVAALPTLLHPGLPLEPGIAGLGFDAALFSASSPPATIARALRSAISCGTLTEAGRQRVNGIEAIELTSRKGSPISETIWVSPDTYLPVRVVIRSAGGFPATQQTADITWLPPTAQNLAKLAVPIPAGFRQVAVAAAVLPILQRTFGTPAPAPQGLCPGPAEPACAFGASAFSGTSG
jgi:hypothetical protein